jgi:hypothetical protein
MTREWQVNRPGQDHKGPYSGHELRQLADAGELLPTDLVWKAGMERRLPRFRTG